MTPTESPPRREPRFYAPIVNPTQLIVCDEDGREWLLSHRGSTAWNGRQEVTHKLIDFGVRDEYTPVGQPIATMAGWRPKPVPKSPKPRVRTYQRTGRPPGRPRALPNTLRNCNVGCGLTIAEYKAIADAAHEVGRTMAEHVREILVTTIDAEKLAALVRFYEAHPDQTTA